MRIILDTNVVMSGVFFGGLPERILKAWQKEQLKLVVSPDILAEYIRVAKYLSSRHPEIEFDEILALIASYSEVCNSPRLAKPVCSDPDDDMFLACFVSRVLSSVVRLLRS